MWKDFFYYSKSERRSILVLVGMGILLLFSGTWIHRSFRLEVPLVDSIALDSFLVRDYQKRRMYDSLRWRKKENVTPALFEFDPNTADSALLRQLGLPGFLARRIVNYRAKGGVFRKKEDFSRIYGMRTEDFERLMPYIAIDSAVLAAKRNQRYAMNTDGSSAAIVDSNGLKGSADGSRVGEGADASAIDADSFKRSNKYPEGTVVDLNAADTTQLKRVPGIGSGLAKMIVAYRNRLGGYAEVAQLQEIAHVDSTVNRWFTIKTQIHRPLRINHAGLDQLRNHPYMNFYKAKVILEFRRKRGQIKGLSQLSMFQEFTERDLQKLKPYLVFE